MPVTSLIPAPVTVRAAGWCAACMTISTLSGSRWLSVMATDEASRTEGMWFSVVMCAGMAGEAEAYRPSSCTLRSKICEDAGDPIRGEEGIMRLGDVGAIDGFRVAELMEGSIGGCIGAVVVILATGETFFAAVAVVVTMTPPFLGSSFFFPNPQNFRLPVFGSCS